MFSRDVGIRTFIKLIEELRRLNYHLYTPQETVNRAMSKLGEKKYNLIFNNCEHFAAWCKTGLSESRQIDELIRSTSQWDDDFIKRISVPR